MNLFTSKLETENLKLEIETASAEYADKVQTVMPSDKLENEILKCIPTGEQCIEQDYRISMRPIPKIAHPDTHCPPLLLYPFLLFTSY